VQIRDAGNAVSIRGSHQVPEQNASVRFVRIWVKRPEAWQLLIYQETAKQRRNPKSAAGLALQATAHRQLRNPRKTIPYKTDNPAEQEVASMCQAVKCTVLTDDISPTIFFSSRRMVARRSTRPIASQ